MFISTYLDDVVVWAPAKVNLFLELLKKRDDGYHEINTLMVAIRLFDTLVLREEPASRLTMVCSDKRLSIGEDNLVLKAANLLRDRTGCKKGAHIRLVKRIPMAAGLAGGSTDAAATFAGLNQLWQLGLNTRDLAKISSEIGSDIPFFLEANAAWCTGRGEIVTPVELPSPLDFVLICPSFGLSTVAVYKNVALPSPPVSDAEFKDAIAKGDVDSIGRFMHNRLQLAAERIEPRVSEYATMLADTKPAGSLLSGSGSTLYALCRSADDARRVAAGLKTRTKAHDFRVIVTRTI